MKNRRIISIFVFAILLLTSCSKNESEINNFEDLPIRSGPRPETTTEIPHVQIDVEAVPEVYDEMVRRIYSIPGIEDRPAYISTFRALWISENQNYVQQAAYISGREFGHIHPDGSLHIFLDPNRANEAIETFWAVDHPFDLDGFVMLYTPQSFDELNVTFQLIVDGFNYVTGQQVIATDYYD
jgi:phospholipase/carboxylesterase